MANKSLPVVRRLSPAPLGVSLIGPTTRPYFISAAATSAYFAPQSSGMEQALLLSLANDIVQALTELVPEVKFNVQYNMIVEPCIVAHVPNGHRELMFYFVKEGIFVMDDSITIEYADPTMIDQMAEQAANLLH